MLASSFEAISTSTVIYFNAHNFTFELTSFYYNFYITLFVWLKQLRSLSIDTPFRAIPTKQPASSLPPRAPSKRAPSTIPLSKSIHRLPISSSTNLTPRCIRQQKSKPPKSQFKALLIVTLILQKGQKNVPLQPDPQRPQEPHRGARQWLLPPSHPLRS